MRRRIDFAVVVRYDINKFYETERCINMAELSFAMSTLALLLYSLSYFFNNKQAYLMLQLVGNVFLSLSYLLMGAYFTMVSVALGIARGLICYAYEKRNKSVPVFVILALCMASILSYIIIDYIILSEAMVWDMLYLLASCMYAVTFAMRNIRLMRYIILVPHACAILYNLLVKAPISSAISYSIEFVVTVVAIIKYEIQAIKCRRNA